MRLKTMFVGLGILSILLALGTGAMAAETKGKQPSVTRARVITATATVEAIDLAKREVTLKGPKGNVETVVVDERVKNLPQVKVGDQVVVKYYEALALRVMAPGEAPSASATGGVTTAQPGQKPAALGAREVTVTAVVKDIDQKAGTVTFTGPRGNDVTVKAQDPENLKLVKVGDKVEITYSEALAISVQEAKKKS